MLLVHGIGGGSSLFQYRKNAAELARRGYEVYALDLLGFGRSSRPPIRMTQDLHVGQLESFIATVIGEPTALIGNGLSAAYSIRLAAERPDLIEALVLIGPTGYERLAREQGEARVEAFETFRGFLGNVLYTLLVAENIQEIFLLGRLCERGEFNAGSPGGVRPATPRRERQVGHPLVRLRQSRPGCVGLLGRDHATRAYPVGRTG